MLLSLLPQGVVKSCLVLKTFKIYALTDTHLYLLPTGCGNIYIIMDKLNKTV